MLVFVLASRRMNAVSIVGFSLVIAGGIGNLIDRIGNGGVVTDFMNLGIGRIRTGIFNVADVIIMIGVAVLLVHMALDREGGQDTAGAGGRSRVG
jgi:signal peptidase II